jgi:hypothetical protein
MVSTEASSQAFDIEGFIDPRSGAGGAAPKQVSGAERVIATPTSG